LISCGCFVSYIPGFSVVLDEFMLDNECEAANMKGKTYDYNCQFLS